MSNKRKLSESTGNENDSTGTSEKRKRRIITDEKIELTKVYENLANDDETVRIAAALDIVSKCKDNNGAGREPSFEVAKPICIRLIRGVCSNRKSARHGFFIALVEVLRLFKASPELRKECLSLIERETRLDQGGDGQEKRNNALGRMSAYTAIIHSKLFFHGSQTQQSRFESILSSILDTYNQHPWLEEQIASLLTQSIDILRNDQAPTEWQRAIIDITIQRKLTHSPLGIGLWLELQQRAPSVKLPKNIWHHQDPLSSEELPNVIRCMKRSTGSSEQSEDDVAPNARLGARQSRPSFAWMVIIRRLQNHAQHNGKMNPAITPAGRKLAKFWNEAVDGNFFAPSASHEKKQLGFSLLTQALDISADWLIDVMLSHHLVQCLVNQSVNPDRYLSTQARAINSRLVEHARSRPSSGVRLVESLCFGMNARDFDHATRTDTIQNIVDNILLSDDHAMMQNVFVRLFDDDGSDSQSLRSRRQLILKLLSTMLRKSHAKLASDTDTKGVYSIVDFLAARAYGGAKDSSQVTHTLEVKNIIRAELISALASHISHRDDYALKLLGRVSTFCIPDQNGLAGADLRMVDYFRSEMASATEARYKVKYVLAIQLLTAICLVNTKNEGEEASEAWEMARELKDMKENFVIDSRAPHGPVDPLVGMILALTVQPLALSRRVAAWVFDLVSEHMQDSGLGAMIDVLEKNENLSGKTELEQENESENNDGEDSPPTGENQEGNGLVVDNVEMDSDVEEVESDEEEDDDEDSDDHTVEDGDNAQLQSSSSSDAGSEDSELTRFNATLASTLGTANGAESDVGSSASSMDDDEMLALEPQLAAMFKQRLAQGVSSSKSSKGRGGEKKQEQAMARRSIREFKNRVLDMLASYLTKHPRLPLTLETAVPLLKLVRTTKSKQLRDKTARIIKSHHSAARKRGSPPTSLDPLPTAEDASHETADNPNSTWETLSAVHTEALQPSSHQHAYLCSSTSLFICRCIIQGAKNQPDAEKVTAQRMQQMEKMYQTTRKEWDDSSRRQGQKGEGLSRAFWDDFEGWRRDLGR